MFEKLRKSKKETNHEINLRQFSDKEIIEIFNNPQEYDEKELGDAFAYLRWGDKIKSPYNSQFTKIYDYGDSRYRCANTQMTFRVTTNSVFHVSKLKYQKIFTIIREYYNGDTNTCKLAKLIHVTEKTAWTILYRIKYVSQDMTNEDKRDIISFTRKLLAFEKIKHIIVPSETETKKRTIKLKPKYKSNRRGKVDRQMSLRTREQAEAEYKQTRIEELRNGILLMLQSEMVEIPVEFIQEYNELLSKKLLIL